MKSVRNKINIFLLTTSETSVKQKCAWTFLRHRREIYQVHKIHDKVVILATNVLVVRPCVYTRILICITYTRRGYADP